MSVYDAEAYIAKAIASVLEQTEQDFEIVVVDDCSRDKTREIVREFAGSDGRVRLLTTERNTGFAYCVNFGIRESRGDWVTFLDADDWYDRHRLARLVGLGIEHDAPMVADNLYFIEDKAAKPWRTLFAADESAPRRLSLDEFLVRDMPGRHGTWGLLQPALRADFLRRHGIAHDEEIPAGSDSFFLIGCLSAASCLLLSSAHYYYRLRPDSMSATMSIDTLRILQHKNSELARTAAAAMPPATSRLIERRIRSMDRFIRYREVVVPLKDGRIGAALRAAAADPAILPNVLIGLARVALSRAYRLIPPPPGD